MEPIQEPEEPVPEPEELVMVPNESIVEFDEVQRTPPIAVRRSSRTIRTIRLPQRYSPSLNYILLTIKVNLNVMLKRFN